VIGRFGAIAQLGYKVMDGSDAAPNAPRRYARYGWRYHFNDHCWGTSAVRAIENRKADAVEFGAGYSMHWR
jgi:hypothetical protein